MWIENTVLHTWYTPSYTRVKFNVRVHYPGTVYNIKDHTSYYRTTHNKYVFFSLFTHVGASVTFGLCFVLPVLYCQFCIARNCTQLFFFILFFLSSPFSFYAAHTGQDEDILEDLSMFRNSCVVLMIDPLLPFDKDC